MNKLSALFIFVVTSAFVFNGALADEHGSKKMDKQQPKEMKMAAEDEGKTYKYNKHSDEGDEDDDDHETDRDKSNKNGLDKQREKKADQEHTEEGKGSEQGQASQEEHSRKWWKFWGE